MDFGEKYGPWAVIAGGSEGTGLAFARKVAAAGVSLVLVAKDGRLSKWPKSFAGISASKSSLLQSTSPATMPVTGYSPQWATGKSACSSTMPGRTSSASASSNSRSKTGSP